MSERRYWEVFKTGAGWVLVEATDSGITRLSLPQAAKPASPASSAAAAVTPHLNVLRSQLRSYFAGKPVRFTVSLDLASLPKFTADVLKAASRIPYGEARTYGDVARMAGKPGAARAVGQAMGRNPIPVVIPCHRVVAARGLGGYSGGLDWKRRLLRLESSVR